MGDAIQSDHEISLYCLILVCPVYTIVFTFIEFAFIIIIVITIIIIIIIIIITIIT